MKNKIIFFCLSLFYITAPLQAAGLNTALSGQPREITKILINNRILAHVNDKAITTYDVAKKMDILFYRQFPQYLSFPEARYQFYLANWESVLEELIYKELILADAKEHKVEISSGDVRQEMEALFGPNIIENLDKAGMTFDEASKIVQGDLIIQKMVNFQVNAKALRVVTPAKVKEAYDFFAKDPKNTIHTKWNYQVITIKDRNMQKAEEVSNKAYRLLIEDKVPLNDLAVALKDKKILTKKSKVTVSEPIVSNEIDLSESYKAILSHMNDGMISQPFANKSRTTSANVYRILVLNNKIPGGVPPFKEVENRIKETLLNKAADQETEKYVQKLRQRYHLRDKDIKAMIPTQYQPFTAL